MAPGLDDDLALAHRLADAADAVSLAGPTGTVVAHELEADGSPVSAVDRAVEGRIGEILAAERPADGMLGEEVGAHGPQGRRWIVDGIDGTVLFVAGRTGWATQVALEVDGQVVVGVTTVPAAGRRWWATCGQGASRSGSVASATWRAPATASSHRGRRSRPVPARVLVAEAALGALAA